jgi:hypothetical protein
MNLRDNAKGKECTVMNDDIKAYLRNLASEFRDSFSGMYESDAARVTEAADRIEHLEGLLRELGTYKYKQIPLSLIRRIDEALK